MKNRAYLISFILTIIIIAFGTICTQLNKENDIALLNKGCKICGEEYELFDIEQERGWTYYYYKCENCGNMYRSLANMEER